MTANRSVAYLLLLVAGLLIWSSAFIWLYGALSVGCAFGWERVAVGPVSLQRAVLLGLWMTHLAVIAALLAFTHGRLKQHPGLASLDGFFAGATFWASVVALGVTFVNYAPILALSTCL
ncbi:hypothetical protein Sa4125_05260 [Aureimonas sp. SA4125]|uniref:hypothetical protein n=1 Tax=Aureimonas sp. SA4125 TaxID=2826993 RepID=UPI001CC46930|nr:hypothetical protein [Aureimonas sp. SA4125]BDA82984.1 hypothetical protein Sa4125_05260 [Aureimonas sp. SA4125]